MNKRDWTLLGRVFAAEIDGRRVHQSKAAGYKRLAEDGMVEHITVTLGADRFGKIAVSCWALTDRGRLLYCAECAKVYPDAD